ncbi:MAG: polysaccharide deacetylase family protein [Elusimicrobiota bacterium]|nr:polysaccharide deacetylase family protein [Endomicrobiia bacterium]MDW8165729.1 polysaccharide deacetylase family protein [Elusimicrobiota bacterium]
MILRRIHFIFISVVFFIFLPSVWIFEEKISFGKDSLFEDFPKKLVSLTFDDGPHPYYTQKIVEILNKYKVKATFFFVGKQVKRYPEIVRYILENSDSKIANHTYSHRNLTKLSPFEIQKELIFTHNLLLEIAEDNYIEKIIPYFRPPGGNYDEKVLKEAEKLGFKITLWSIFVDDINCREKQQLLERIFNSNLQNKEIVLLHSGHSTTVEALPEIIEFFRSKGYEFVTVNEILDETYNVN